MKEFIKGIREIPEEYRQPASMKGTIERIDYKTHDYREQEEDKYAFVYLPYNYDASQAYDIYYLIHGGGETAEKYLYEGGEDNELKHIVDNLIENGDIRPLIIVNPSWYPKNAVDRSIDHGMLTMHFAREILDLMKAVENKYHTYAITVDEKGFRDSRDHRLVGGWSMGACSTWAILSQDMDYFRFFAPMSGDSWMIEQTGGSTKPKETAAALTSCVIGQGYDKDGFSVYCISGTEDPAGTHLTNMVNALKEHPKIWDFDSEERNGSLLLYEGGQHHRPWRTIYIYNVLLNHFA